MSESVEAGSAEGAVWIARRDHALRARFERHHALNAAWEVLAPFGISTEGVHIVEAGRAVGAELARLAAQAFEDRNRAALAKLDKLLDAIESEMRALAFQVPVAELRSALAGRPEGERRGILDLLDVMLGAELQGDGGTAGRIPAIDYLITLCTKTTNADGAPFRDPVGLTPRLQELCERASTLEDPRLAVIEAEFYAAANVDENDAREEVQLRALRRRKRELGTGYFAPNVLRAIVAYNTALSRCIERGVHDSRDWGSLQGDSVSSDAETSVFETDVLPQLALALRRRAEGGSPTSSAIDRVAWCLDSDALEEPEQGALLSPEVGLPGNLEGTTILVGLLCDAAVVLEGEFPGIGIEPDTLATHWVPELDDALKREVGAGVTGSGYERARVLSEMRTRFLYSSMTDVHRERRRATPSAHPMQLEGIEREAREFAGEARQLAGEALETEHTKALPDLAPPWKDWRVWPWSQIVRLGGAATILAILALGAVWYLLSGDLDRMSGSELQALSPYLERGARNGEGQGPAFVGRIDDDWAELPADRQRQAARELVAALRAQGVREVMVYDDDRVLRIQALGEQPVRVLTE